MRSLGTVPNGQLANGFAAYVTAQGCDVSVDHEQIGTDTEGTWRLWVHDEDQVHRLKTDLAEFVQNPQAEKFRVTDKLRTATAAKQQSASPGRSRKSSTEIRMADRWQLKAPVPPVITVLLIAGCVLVAIMTNLGQEAPTKLSRAFISAPTSQFSPQERWSNGLPEVRQGEIWRLVTPILIHFGPAHLIFNLMWLHRLGSMIEGFRGYRFMLLFVLACAVLSNVGQYFWNGPGFGGMSGVGYGLFGYAWIRGTLVTAQPIRVDGMTTFLFLVWFFACLSGAVGPIANVAHAVGLLTGMAAAGIVPVFQNLQRRWGG